MLDKLLNGKKVVLGSASPRRKHLLSGLDIPFTVEAVQGGVRSMIIRCLPIRCPPQ